ncbi:hypothetical protein AFR66_15045 [Listeria monocytogenes]|nr:hypothetical protein [Listeria monocytogenes]
MEVFKAIQDRKVLLVIFLLVLIVCVVFIIGSFKIRKQSRGTALFLLLLGIVGIIASLYGFFFRFCCKVLFN